MVEKRTLYVILYDYYGELISDKKRMIFEDYYFNNLSLSEIADNNKISRNAIHKTIKNVEEKLAEYEEKIKIYEKEEKIKSIISEIEDVELREKIKKVYEG